jgi:hypothetical protein
MKKDNRYSYDGVRKVIKGNVMQVKGDEIVYRSKAGYKFEGSVNDDFRGFMNILNDVFESAVNDREGHKLVEGFVEWLEEIGVNTSRRGEEYEGCD